MTVELKTGNQRGTITVTFSDGSEELITDVSVVDLDGGWIIVHQWSGSKIVIPAGAMKLLKYD